jgi:hypothetical protein
MESGKRDNKATDILNALAAEWRQQYGKHIPESQDHSPQLTSDTTRQGFADVPLFVDLQAV